MTPTSRGRAPKTPFAGPHSPRITCEAGLAAANRLDTPCERGFGPRRRADLQNDVAIDLRGAPGARALAIGDREDATPGRRRARFDNDGTVGFSSSSGAPAATSLAAATVSGAMLAIMDYHMSGGSGWIGNPGNLYAALLVMGDRQQSAGSKALFGVDHRWGVGRLRVRLLGSVGLDAPWYFYHAVTCISHGQSWEFEPLPDGFVDDVNAVKVGAYWFDRRHDTGGNVANIDIALFREDSLFPLSSDVDAHDNKAFVYIADAPNGNVALRLRIAGTNVQGHTDPTCGANSIKVHWAFFAEDSDRDNIAYNPATGIGVAPEDI